MKTNRLAIFIIIMTLFLSAYIFFTLMTYARKISTPPVKEETPAETAKEPQIHQIPENAVPPVQEIEAQIEKRREEDGKKDKAVKAKAALPPAEYRDKEVAPAETETPKPKIGAVSEKKEVKFPTYKEREASRSAGSTVHVY